MPRHPKKLFSLDTAPCGCLLRVMHICPSCPDICRLQELGFSPSSPIRKLAQHSALVCLVHNTRIAIDRELGRHIQVEAV